MARTRASLTAAVVMLLLLPACGVSGLNFFTDDRLTIVSPIDRATVDAPVTISWRVRDFEITGADGSRREDAGYFGLYLDRAPQPPGDTQADLVRDTQACRLDPECPGAEYLARQGVHRTAETSFTLERVPERADEERLHQVILVFLNGRGERIGESAFTVEFEVER